MAQTIVRELGGTKSTVTNQKLTCYSPKGERVTLKPGTIPKTKY